METSEETTETESEPVVHQFGKLMVGSIAGFVAGKLADKAYDKVLVVIRSRRSR